MKRCLIFVSILALAACTTDSGGGSSGGSYNHGISGGYSGTTTNNNTNGGNSGGNTGGNTNNQQNNQVVHYTNFKQYFDNVLQQNTNGVYTDFVETTQSWPSQGGYKHYGYNVNSSTGTQHSISKYVVEEKEMQLANYGVQNYTYKQDFDNEFHDASEYSATAYAHNREGVGANLYTPQENTVFSGGTLAYLDTSGQQADMFLKGNATYTYNSTNPELLIAYDNYYTFNIVKGDGNSETTTVSGTNNTGNAYYDVTPGTYTDNYGYDATFTPNHLKKGNIEEAVGTYQLNFGTGDIGGNTTNNFFIHGAFGGAKQ